MIPAMINRYYVLDLSANNSLAKALSGTVLQYKVDWGEATNEEIDGIVLKMFLQEN